MLLRARPVTGRPPPVAVAAVMSTLLVALAAAPSPAQAFPTGAGPPRLSARTVPVPSDAPARRFGWPLRPRPVVARPFEPPSMPYGPGHRGADLVGVAGQPVLSAGDGTVVYAGPLAGRGVVSVQHADGLRTSYEPVLAEVRPGRLVRRGERLGTLAAGHPGCPVTACLHWGLRRDGRYVDPLSLVDAGHVRLLPWAEG